MESSQSKLTPFQRELLSVFFRHETDFFLTGGAALVGYHLNHRLTTDLDLFTMDDDAFARASVVLRDIAAKVGATVETRQDAPGFQRHFVSRGQESVIVDFVRERVEQLHPEKLSRDGVSVDPADEILANKLTTLISRGEIRDLVDVYELERFGLVVEDLLPVALRKDGGCTPAALSWALSQVKIGDDTELPGAVEPSVLREYLTVLVARLRRAGAPPESNA